MQSKMVFYEGSVHVPLLMRLPGTIPAGTVVRAPVSNMDLFGTIIDYLGLPASVAPNTSRSLRPLVEGSAAASTASTAAAAAAAAAGEEARSDVSEEAARVVFSFWDTDVSPGFTNRSRA